MKKIHLKSLPLNALRAFMLVAKHQSVTEAAKEMGVSHAAISQQLKSLEEYLEIPLFNREGKRLRLSESAQLYAKDLQSAFSQIDNATQRLFSNPIPIY